MDSQPSAVALIKSIRRWSESVASRTRRRIVRLGLAMLTAYPLIGERIATAETAPVQELRIAYVGRLGVEPPAGAVEPLPPPAGVLDNTTTGRFLGQVFRLEERCVLRR
jgi:hypothetical protein